jgi:hypothetical protein
MYSKMTASLFLGEIFREPTLKKSSHFLWLEVKFSIVPEKFRHVALAKSWLWLWGHVISTYHTSKRRNLHHPTLNHKTHSRIVV